MVTSPDLVTNVTIAVLGSICACVGHSTCAFVAAGTGSAPIGLHYRSAVNPLHLRGSHGIIQELGPEAVEAYVLSAHLALPHQSLQLLQAPLVLDPVIDSLCEKR